MMERSRRRKRQGSGWMLCGLTGLAAAMSAAMPAALPAAIAAATPASAGMATQPDSVARGPVEGVAAVTAPSADLTQGTEAAQAEASSQSQAVPETPEGPEGPEISKRSHTSEAAAVTEAEALSGPASRSVESAGAGTATEPMPVADAAGAAASLDEAARTGAEPVGEPAGNPVGEPDAGSGGEPDSGVTPVSLEDTATATAVAAPETATAIPEAAPGEAAGETRQTTESAAMTDSASDSATIPVAEVAQDDGLPGITLRTDAFLVAAPGESEEGTEEGAEGGSKGEPVLRPATALRAGDRVRYIVTVHNGAGATIGAGRIQVSLPVPAGSRYQPGSAGGEDMSVSLARVGEPFTAVEPSQTGASAGAADALTTPDESDVAALPAPGGIAAGTGLVLRWQYDAALPPGAEATLHFEVLLD